MEMKKDIELRITIIGLGNLMEAIFPCIVDTVGKDNLGRQVNATTTDRQDLKRKQEVLGIPVILNDNLTALQENEPDIIFFAPPPSVAPGIIRGELKDYVALTRKKSAALPEIFAFPPSPGGDFYENALGEDMRVVNVLPHPVRLIGGEPLKNEGFYSRTFNRPWPQESKARLKRIFGTFGAGIELKPDQIIPMMGAWIMLEVLAEAVTTLADATAWQGKPVDHRILSKYMRAKAQQLISKSPEKADIPAAEAFEAPLRRLLDHVTVAWYEGLKNYLREVDFPSGLSMDIINMIMDFQLHILEAEDRHTVDSNTTMAATKGGVLERGILCYHQTIEETLKNAVERMPQKTTARWKDVLSVKVTDAAHVVRKHGTTLSG